MSFYSYKNANPDCCPGRVSSDGQNCIREKVCVQVKKVYDSCMQQEQLDDVRVNIGGIAPVPCQNHGCGCCPVCGCDPCTCCNNDSCAKPVAPYCFESCRSSTIQGAIRNLTIERLCDRPNFARIRGIVDIPIDVLFTDARCREFMGHSTVSVPKDVLLCVPDESIVPYTIDTLVSAICVSGTHCGGNTFDITICVTIVLKIISEVEMMIPSYGLCAIPPCEEFAESVCDEFFSLPLFPATSCESAGGSTCSSSCCGRCSSGCTTSCNTSCTTNCTTNCANNCSGNCNCSCDTYGCGHDHCRR